jgi:hypothetical protein
MQGENARSLALPCGEQVILDTPHIGDEKCLAVIKDIWASGVGETNEDARTKLVEHLLTIATEVENLDLN